VTDVSGASLPVADVSIKNLATDVTRDVKTDAAGFYSAPNLLPGSYEVTASSLGFKTNVQTAVNLTVGAQQVLNFTLQVGEVSQKVEVTTQAPAVELATSSVHAVVDSTTIVELPLNGRDWTQLARLQPGIYNVQNQLGTTGNANRGTRGFGSELIIAGHRPYENSYRMNGINTNDYSNGAPGSPIGVNLGVDGIQEFSVLTTDYSADYGRTSGGIVNAMTKSGSNDFHGDAYWFIRDEGFDARNYFDHLPAPLRLPPFHRNQFGAAVGGPIKKNRAFFFFDYEGIRQDQGNTVTDITPSAAARAGSLCSVPNGKCLPSQIIVNPLVVPYLALWPLPNLGLPPGGNGDVGIFSGFGTLFYSENYYTARVDTTISNEDSLSGTYFNDHGSLAQPDAFLDSLSALSSPRQMLSLEETHIFSPTLSNTVRFGYNRSTGYIQQPVRALVPAAGDPSLGAVPGAYAPIMVVAGLSPSSNSGALGAPSEVIYIWNSYQGYDDAFVTKGTHSLRFGFAMEHQQANEKSFGKRNGSFSFGSLTAFLLDAPTSFVFTNPKFSSFNENRQTLFGAYVQDDWRARHNVTLNFGLRYEPVTLPREANDRFQVIKNLSTGGVEPTENLWPSNQTLRNFEPRVGFAWDPFSDGKTAVRGGFGIFNVLPLPWVYTNENASSLPFQETSGAGNLPPGSFPKAAIALALANPTPATVLTSRYVQPNPPASYSMNWNFNIQRAITPTLTAMVGYLGSHTVHQPFNDDDLNIVLPTVTSAGYLWPIPRGSGKEFNTSVGPIKATLWDGYSKYEGLLATLDKKMSHGIQVQGSYTWGKCLDNGTTGNVTDPFLNSIATLSPFVPPSRVGLCDFQISHSFVVNYIWQLPNPKIGSVVAERVLGGWQLGGIFTANTGTPFTLFIGGDPVGMNNTGAYDYPNRLAGCNPVNGNFKSQGLTYVNLNCFALPTAPASFASVCQPFPTAPKTCENLFGDAGRNRIIGPNLVNFDFSLFKNIPIREALTIQFRVECFNILNRANFQAPVSTSTIFNQTGSLAGGAGTISATTTTAREIQFGLKLNW
jgi:hypothetical protein